MYRPVCIKWAGLYEHAHGHCRADTAGCERNTPRTLRERFCANWTNTAINEESIAMTFLEKIRGENSPLPPLPPTKAVLLAWLGGFVAIAAVAGLTDMLTVALVLGSFGASCVLVFGYPDVPFSQPRNVVAGH